MIINDIESENIPPEAERLFICRYFIETRSNEYFCTWCRHLDTDTLDFIIDEMKFVASLPEHMVNDEPDSLSEKTTFRISDIVTLASFAIAHDSLLDKGHFSTNYETISEIASKIDPSVIQTILNRINAYINLLKNERMGVITLKNNKPCNIIKYNPSWVVTDRAHALSATLLVKKDSTVPKDNANKDL